MNRKKRTEILIRGSAGVAGKLAEEILHRYDVTTVEKSNNGMVMVKVRESAQRSLFYLGEVFITECKVMVNGHLGIGMVRGHEPELAYSLAVVDAACNANLPETKDWDALLLLEESRIHQAYAASMKKIIKTKVNFDTMDV